MPKAAKSQLSLFGGGGPDPSGPEAVVTPAQRALAARLPSRLYLGTSSWTFPGWAGIVYAGRPSKEKLVTEGLSAYAKHPLLRTVCFDRSYYVPPTLAEWQAYARQLPAGFVAVAKAFSEVTTAVFPDHPRLGERAGQPNPRFLDVELARSQVVGPYLEGMGERAGPMIFELPPIPARLVPDEDAFLERLDGLFAALPSEGRYAVELRTPKLFTPRYLEVLRRHGVAHVFNFWGAMPPISEQVARAKGMLPADVILRLMLPPGASYDALKEAYAPFDRLVETQPRMRKDALALMRAALDEGRSVFVIVNNKAEGSAPLTLFALAEALVG